MKTSSLTPYGDRSQTYLQILYETFFMLTIMNMGEMGNAHKILVRKPEWILGKVWEGVDVIHMAQDRD